MPDDQSSRLNLPAASVRRRRRRWPWLLILPLLPLPLLLVVDLPLPLTSAPPPAPAITAVTVRAATAERGDVPIYLKGLGVVTPFSAVVVRTQISGQLQSVGFHEGQTVRQGDFIAQIDPRPYEATLAAAAGQRLRDQALLDQARTDLARYLPLVQHDEISRQKYEDQASLVHQYEGTIVVDEAQMASARLNLSYCHIVAPITGRVGLRQVDPGNYVQSSDPSGLVVITELQPISVVFPLPQDDLPQVMRRLGAASELPVSVYGRHSPAPIEAGMLESVDNVVDVATGTAKLRARFANRANELFPNQLVSAELQVDMLRDAVVVPDAAIQEGAEGHYVWLIQPDRRVRLRPVTTGPAADGRVAILTGLDAGARVVVDGADRLREGAKVAVAEGTPAQ